MPVVACRECGGQVAPSAPTCPHCGAPEPAPRTAAISVTRLRSQILYSQDFTVSLNGRESGVVGNGATWESTVPAGHHDVQVSFVATQLGKSQQQASADCDVTDGESARFECGFPKTFWSTPKLYLTRLGGTDALPSATPKAGGAQCSGCGAVLSGTEKFCGRCGAEVSGKRCESCGTVFLGTEKFCGRCGAEVSA
jgi:RNA polymerase subunit RPABC4/transcription elongation factor Spt4